MTSPDNAAGPEQLGRAEIKRLAREDPAAIVEAMRDGRLRDVMAGREPGDCPHCGRSMTDPPPTT